MPLPRQSREVDIGDTSDFDVIERQAALQVHCTGLGFEIGPAEVACRGVKPDAELCPAFRCGKLDVHIPPIDTLLQGFYTLFRAQPSGKGMTALRQAFDEGCLRRIVLSRGRRRWGTG